MLKFRSIFILFSAILAQACSSNAQPPSIKIGNTTVFVDTIITGLDVPWEIIWGPDNHIWMTERKGIVSRVNPVTKTKTVILDLTASVYRNSESGMLGMALHPDFPSKPEVFIVYTYRIAPNIRERLVKYQYNGSMLVNPDTLLDGIIGNTTHCGSRLLFLPDKTLLMTTGDAQAKATPLDTNAINGKVLRLNTDGSIPADNPFPGKYVYSLGHRNAQGILLAPNGKIYLSEHGPNNDDEFQIVMKGRNYGWPTVEGFCNLPAEATFCSANNIVEPLMAWTPTIAPSDIAYYSNSAFPELDGCILMTVLKDKKLIALKLNSDGSQVSSQTHYLTNSFGRLRDVLIGPNKEIYLATNGADWGNVDPNTHSIIRLTAPINSSVKQTAANNGIQIYPNPVSCFLNIDINSFFPSGITIQLLDVSGRICMEEKTMEDKVSLSLADLAKGIYILRIINEGQVLMQTRIFN